MNRTTSAIAYRQLVESGQLKAKQRDVSRAFVEHGPGTTAEVLRAAGMDSNLNLMRARVTELRDAGILRERGARKCHITGRTAVVFAFEPGAKPIDRMKPHERAEAWEALATKAIGLAEKLAQQIDEWNDAQLYPAERLSLVECQKWRDELVARAQRGFEREAQPATA